VTVSCKTTQFPYERKVLLNRSLLDLFLSDFNTTLKLTEVTSSSKRSGYIDLHGIVSST